jgi:4'-phosphopantetheinyl transferase EntD
MAIDPPVNQKGLTSPISEDGMASNQSWIESIGRVLFPSPCVIAVQRYDSVEIPFPATNDATLSRATEKRRREFSAGRAAAATALQKLNAPNAYIPVGANRNPLWPDGIVGSITHTAGIAIAVVARREQIASLGIDLEVAGALKRDLWAGILSEREIVWISAKPSNQHERLATLFFCAKESFYKLQYPLTGTWVDFHDAEVMISTDTNEFQLTCILPRVVAKLHQSRFSGYYAIGTEFALAAMSLAHSEPQ